MITSKIAKYVYGEVRRVIVDDGVAYSIIGNEKKEHDTKAKAIEYITKQGASNGRSKQGRKEETQGKESTDKEEARTEKDDSGKSTEASTTEGKQKPKKRRRKGKKV